MSISTVLSNANTTNKILISHSSIKSNGLAKQANPAQTASSDAQLLGKKVTLQEMEERNRVELETKMEELSE